MMVRPLEALEAPLKPLEATLKPPSSPFKPFEGEGYYQFVFGSFLPLQAFSLSL